ncbi:Uncharacterized protein TCM_032282 [Theobroma cacao]|uniref:UspA domain-containing protein n=1 Tax=Theobroma cacao TaxID=3641 RepID=A0A061F9X2_THECC|nr:Uncharacterized protein TCM_032282 [Theobroma cacao]
MEGLNMYGNGVDNGLVIRKRVMVVVDQSSHCKHAMMWALTHVANKCDLLTLLHVISPSQKSLHLVLLTLLTLLGHSARVVNPRLKWKHWLSKGLSWRQ